MATTAGALSQVSVTSTVATLSSAAATAGTGPYTYQWYRSTTSGFTPGGGNIITGATSLSLVDSGLIPNTQYYYKVVATDSGAVTGTSAQLAVATTMPVIAQNVISIAPFVGQVDEMFNYNSLPVQIDASETGTLYSGQAVKIYDSAGGIPKVVACSANADDVFGFINFAIKGQALVAGDRCSISQAGNVIYLYATAAIARGAQVQLDVSTKGGVAPKTGSSGADIVGFALDKASAAGALIRVKVSCPGFLKA